MPEYRRMKVTVEIEVTVNGIDDDGTVINKVVKPLKALKIEDASAVKVNYATAAQR